MLKPKLYIAEDDSQLSEVWRKIALMTNWEVSISLDGRQLVLALERSTEPALVIVDIYMPELDGIEVIEHIAKLDRSMRVLFVSGGQASFIECACSIAKSKGLSVGQTIRKPVSVEGFVEVLRYESAKLAEQQAGNE